MADQIKWGILGTGNIAHQFADGLLSSHEGVNHAVASRDGNKALSFATEYSIAKAFGSYDELIAEPSVDAIYLSLPNNLHCEWTIKALNAGKHVLCEKPIATTLEQAKQMFAAAKANDRVLMEAFMYLGHPQTQAALTAVKQGVVGKVSLIKTSFSYATNKIDGNVRFDPTLCGGALMDVGCYCLSLSRLFAGEEPNAAHASGTLHRSGVDIQTTGHLQFPNGIQASFSCGMNAQTDNTAYICGNEGYIAIPIPWKPQPGQAEYQLCNMTAPKMDGKVTKFAACEPMHVPNESNIFTLEADAFAQAARGEIWPPVSEAHTLGNMALLEQLRKDIGLAY